MDLPLDKFQVKSNKKRGSENECVTKGSHFIKICTATQT